LILSKIIEIVATRCHILKPKCTKFDFGGGYAPDPAVGITALPLAGFKGPTFKGSRRGRTGGKGKRREREGEGK